jgi:hypothetical protein
MTPLSFDFNPAHDTKPKRLNRTARSRWEEIMRRLAALFPIVLALGAIILAPRGGAQAQDAREEGLREIEKCQTISKPGSYKLVNNLTGPLTANSCLLITADFVAIDLGGFTITGNGSLQPSGTGIGEVVSGGHPHLQGIAVRNGSISNFASGIDLLQCDGCIVEGLRVFGLPRFGGSGISVGNGIVRYNTLFSIPGIGILARGTVTGNNVSNSGAGFDIFAGSTVIGNTASGNGSIGFSVECPSNVTDNTAVGNPINLSLVFEGCNNTNNVAP